MRWLIALMCFVPEIAHAGELERMGERSAQTGLLVTGGLMLVLALVKRYTRTQQKGSETISIVSRKQVSARGALVIVQVEGRKLLLSQSGDSFQLLTELKAPEQSFASILSEEIDGPHTAEPQAAELGVAQSHTAALSQGAVSQVGGA